MKMNQTKKIVLAKQWNAKLNPTEYTQRKITYGKYAGVMIKDLPIDYLKWAIINLGDYWASYFARELQRREPKWKYEPPKTWGQQRQNIDARNIL